MALRFSIGSLLLLPFLQRWGLANLQGLALAVVGGIGYAVAVYHGFQHTSALHGSVLLSGAIPFGAALFSALLLGDRPGLLRLIGLACIGVAAVVMLLDSSQPLQLQGDTWLLVAVAAWSLYTVLIKRWNIPPLSGAVTVAWGSMLLYLPVYFLWLPKQISMTGWSDILLQGFYQGVIATVVAMLLYLRAVASIGPAAMGALMALVPAASALLAVPLLKESISFASGCALFFASVGSILASGLIRDRRLAVRAPHPSS
jgi:drug/metabolite transporter (DMT)-like permease